MAEADALTGPADCVVLARHVGRHHREAEDVVRHPQPSVGGPHEDVLVELALADAEDHSNGARDVLACGRVGCPDGERRLARVTVVEEAPDHVRQLWLDVRPVGTGQGLAVVTELRHLAVVVRQELQVVAALHDPQSLSRHEVIVELPRWAGDDRPIEVCGQADVVEHLAGVLPAWLDRLATLD